jgi:hypothetical protein
MGKGERPAKGIRQIVVVHRNYGSLDKERYAIKFEGPVLTDAGLGHLAKAIRSALRKEGCKIIESGYTAALRGGLGWGLRR